MKDFSRDMLCDDLWESGSKKAKTAKEIAHGASLHRLSCGVTQHPTLELPGGKGFKIDGGSCICPAVTDADVYIGFDTGMERTDRQFPWTPGHELLFKINDMAAPPDPKAFAKLIDWALAQLEAGAKIHCGCIGGHGRTGTFLSALVATLGEKDAISYVRDKYCSRAVETPSQIEFLVKHYGVVKVAGSKAFPKGKTLQGFSLSSPSSLPRSTLTPKVRTFEPMKGSSVWGVLCN